MASPMFSKLADPAARRSTDARARRVWFTTEEVHRISGASLRQLCWWCERGILRPATVGSRRNWGHKDLLHACLVNEFRARIAAGSFKLDRLKRILALTDRRLRQLGLTPDAPLPAGGALYMLTDGKGVRLDQSAAQVIARLTPLKVGAHLIDLGEIWRRITKFQIPK